MAKKTGKFAKVEIDVDGTPVEIACLREWSISVSTASIDASCVGTEWTSSLPGLKSWEGEATTITVDEYWLNYIDQTPVISFYDDGEEQTEPSYQGPAKIDFERSASYDDVIESTLSFTGAGPLTSPAQDAQVV